MTANIMMPREPKVLLVGEGNFSFTVSLLRELRQADVTATCLQEENPYSEEQRCYMSQAEEMGARVFTNVNARCLHLHPSTCDNKFDWIIFNFPHIGGKMKICKNRKLLKDFFISASEILAPKGEIWVTLCKGQGGTPADSSRRRKDDTWKVVEMAAYGGLVLTAVQQFNATDYTDYNPIGYRSGEKPFSIEGALTHIFEWRGFLDVHHARHQHDYMVEHIRAAFSQDSHPLCMVIQRIEYFINVKPGSDCVSIHNGSDWCVSVSGASHKTNSKCCLSFVPKQSTSPLDPPFTHVVELRGLDGWTTGGDAKSFLSKVLGLPTLLTDRCCQVTCNRVDTDSTMHVVCRNLCVGTLTTVDSYAVLCIKLEQAAMALFDMADWRMLLPSDYKESLYPEEYWLDSSFWVPEEFSETEFLKVTRLAVGPLLHSLFLVDRYKDSRTGRTSMCYRFCYRSLNHALTREAAKHIHEVARAAAEQQLGVQLR